MRRLSVLLSAACLCVAAVAVAAPPASAAADSGATVFQVNYDSWNTIKNAGVAFYGGDPGGGTIIAPGRPAMELPVKSLKSGVATHGGTLIFTRADAMYFRSVVLDNVVFDFGKKKVTARVYATDTDLGKKTMFTLKHVKYDAPMYDFALTLTAEGAATLNSSLNVTAFTAGMRIGSGTSVTIRTP